ncbi:hypothetical protein GCM10009821_28220 [Aeromicrobium halocynthiae]|uniref:Uncharacterized protein n=1 Tax=Aeromicrobium halocynthiae TaxID=560557 RepID=A0ABN2W6J7_9ACTN
MTDARQRTADGELDLEDLPTWAKTDERDGAPIIIDFATVPLADVASRQDDLRGHFEDLGRPLDEEEIRTCADELTQRDVEATDGKRQAG